MQAAHVFGTIDVIGDFNTPEEMGAWFKNDKYIYFCENAAEETGLHNLKINPYFSTTRNGEKHIDIEFDTDLNEVQSRFELEFMADLDEDGNHPVNGTIVNGTLYSFEYKKN